MSVNHVFIREDTERESSSMNLSPPMLLTSLLKQKQVMGLFPGKTRQSQLQFKICAHQERRRTWRRTHTHANLIYRCTQEAHLVVCGSTEGMLTMKLVM